jgi:exopolysaccharide production protein ExoY
MSDKVMLQSRPEDHPVARHARLRAKVRPKLKRAFDASASLILLLILLPVAILIMLAITMSGQVPLYSHTRIGRGGREFGCLKFRTMRRDADVVLEHLLRQDPAAKLEWETHRKLRHDTRVTRIGSLLRVTSLDELPQLLNVLAGDMSLVGPRPITRDELAKFYSPLAAAAYCSVRPGLTGLWQISGRSEVGYAQRVTLDTDYALHLSLRSDFVILFRTIDVLVRRKGAW